MGNDAPRLGPRTKPSVLAAFLAGLALLIVASASPAGAHEGEEDDAPEGSTLVQQAIAILVNTPDDVMAATDKVEDALATSDQVGVDVDLLSQAADALAAGDIHEARSLLERSIGAQPHLNDADPAPIGEVGDEVATPTEPDSPTEPATGADPGVAVANDPLETARDLNGGDWAALAVLVAIGAAGVALSLRFRPHPSSVGSGA